MRHVTVLCSATPFFQGHTVELSGLMADDAVHQIELQQDKEEWERLHSKHTLSQYVTMGLSRQ